MEAPTNIRGFLSGHAAMLVEVDRIVRHGHLPVLSLRHLLGKRSRPCLLLSRRPMLSSLAASAHPEPLLPSNGHSQRVTRPSRSGNCGLLPNLLCNMQRANYLVSAALRRATGGGASPPPQNEKTRRRYAARAAAILWKVELVTS